MPREIDEHEKKEIRKWVWVMLSPFTELKMKIAYFADPHPEFLRVRGLDELCKADFHDVLMDIMNPNRWMEHAQSGKAETEEEKRERELNHKRREILAAMEKWEKTLHEKQEEHDKDPENEAVEKKIVSLRRKIAGAKKALDHLNEFADRVVH